MQARFQLTPLALRLLILSSLNAAAAGIRSVPFSARPAAAASAGSTAEAAKPGPPDPLKAESQA